MVTFVNKNVSVNRLRDKIQTSQSETKIKKLTKRLKLPVVSGISLRGFPETQQKALKHALLYYYKLDNVNSTKNSVVAKHRFMSELRGKKSNLKIT
jgi:hypothetical protein